MEGNLPAEAQKQQEKTFQGNPKINLHSPCRIGDGILKFSDSEIEQFLDFGMKSKQSISFFIPASGSGSRMFQFLYAYLENPNEENTAMVENFFNSMEEFAFYTLLPIDLRQRIADGDYDTKEIVLYILNGQGLRLGQKPKALVPFHRLGNFVLNPIQEQILQGENVHFTVEQMHFTIQQEFEDEIDKSINNLRKFSGPGRKIGFSYQESSTDAYSFRPDGSIAVDENENMIKRPAGHGALLPNLNKIQEETVLIKNIDNIQHWDQHKLSQRYWQLLIGILDKIQSETRNLIENFDRIRFEQCNAIYELIHSSEIGDWKDEDIIQLMKRPIRVCGMVRNIGQPGGGPYWVNTNGILSKQIVEKSQIASEQQPLMIKSTHFNPVMIALSTVDRMGKKYDLSDFVDEDKFFVVNKEYKGKQIKFCELPGLWNGSMANWNTVFVEVPNATFSPVKTILDLLKPIHQPNK